MGITDLFKSTSTPCGLHLEGDLGESFSFR